MKENIYLFSAFRKYAPQKKVKGYKNQYVAYKTRILYATRPLLQIVTEQTAIQVAIKVTVGFRCQTEKANMPISCSCQACSGLNRAFTVYVYIL